MAPTLNPRVSRISRGCTHILTAHKQDHCRSLRHLLDVGCNAMHCPEHACQSPVRRPGSYFLSRAAQSKLNRRDKSAFGLKMRADEQRRPVKADWGVNHRCRARRTGVRPSNAFFSSSRLNCRTSCVWVNSPYLVLDDEKSPSRQRASLYMLAVILRIFRSLLAPGGFVLVLVPLPLAKRLLEDIWLFCTTQKCDFRLNKSRCHMCSPDISLLEA
jgi:hypothetical protein